MSPDLIIRPALKTDRTGLALLTETSPFIHRHLDWRVPLDWLGCQPFWLAENHQRILSSLACPMDPPGIAWIRLFAARDSHDADYFWAALFEKARQELSAQPDACFAAIALYPWLSGLLLKSGFHLHQQIVVLEWNAVPRRQKSSKTSTAIRPMHLADLPAVTRVDNAAFSLLWQNSYDSLCLAFNQSAYSSVAVLDGQIVGYQISTALAFSAHLARLAVLPGLQRQSIGSLLVTDLLEYFWTADLLRVTVNTQADNFSSLSLYQNLGFTLTGDKFDVFVYP